MNPRIVWLAAALAGPILVAGVALPVSGRSEQGVDVAAIEPAGPPSRVPDSDSSSPPHGSGERSPDSAVDRRGAEAEHHHNEVDRGPPLSTEELWADIADPNASDLPREVFHAAADVATAVVIADTTGDGRDRWPDYWRGQRSEPCCQDVTIHAAGARSHPEHPRDVLATVAWTGLPHPHVRGTYTERISRVRLTPDEVGGWKPAR